MPHDTSDRPLHRGLLPRLRQPPSHPLRRPGPRPARHHGDWGEHRENSGPRMSSPTLDLSPVLVDDRSRPAASTRTLDAELLERATRHDYQQWLSTALAAGGCVRPIRLRGTLRNIDAATGEILHDLDTGDLPD